MTARAIVNSFSNSHTDFANSEYVINVTYFLTDGATFDNSLGTEIHIPFSLSNKKADAFIRQKISDLAFSVYAVTIDPDDIYIPFSAR